MFCFFPWSLYSCRTFYYHEFERSFIAVQKWNEFVLAMQGHRSNCSSHHFLRSVSPVTAFARCCLWFLIDIASKWAMDERKKLQTKQNIFHYATGFMHSMVFDLQVQNHLYTRVGRFLDKNFLAFCAVHWPLPSLQLILTTFNNCIVTLSDRFVCVFRRLQFLTYKKTNSVILIIMFA